MGGAALGGKRIKREYVPQIAESFLLCSGLCIYEHYICGSYRRGRAECGDIEIVFCINDGEELFIAKKKIGKIFEFNLNGDAKMQGLWGEIQFDLFIANDKSLGAMLMHATGSGLFNIKMRSRAKMFGLKLNQYGLWRGRSGETDVPVVLGRDEEAIFTYLSEPWKYPEERDIT